jgi:uncharacterized OB-fold protein
LNSTVSAIPGVSCPKCHWSDFYKAQLCPRCLTTPIETTLPGRGRIVTFTVIRYPPSGFENQAPYVVALIDLTGGPRVIGRINADPEEVEIGMMVTFSRVTSGALEFALTS